MLGPRQLQDLLSLLDGLSLGGAKTDPGLLADCWRAAAAVYREFAVTEAGAADDAQIEPLPRTMRAHVAKLIETPALRATFGTVPIAFGMVALETLIVSQYTLTRSVVERLCGVPAVGRGQRMLAAMCLPLEQSRSDFGLVFQDGSEFVFASDAHDMRFLAARVLPAEAVTAAAMPGHAQAVLALGVGFSSNVLDVVRFNNRMVLNNGHHRAFALRRMGFTHVPCLIQACANEEELSLAASAEIQNNSDLYFEAPRPPLLRDFDHPVLARSFQVPRLRRLVRLKIEVESQLVAL